MFARTQRLSLRPGWIEDAPDLARSIGHHEVVRNLSRAPWPYTLGDAQAFLSLVSTPTTPQFLICAVHDGISQIVGGIGIGPFGDELHELGYWIAPEAWGRGYATEAGKAVIDLARTLRIDRITARHAIDNPASGRVLRKLGFRPTGRVGSYTSLGRGCEVQSIEFEQRLSESDCTDPCDRMAA